MGTGVRPFYAVSFRGEGRPGGGGLISVSVVGGLHTSTTAWLSAWLRVGGEARRPFQRSQTMVAPWPQPSSTPNRSSAVPLRNAIIERQRVGQGYW